MIKLTFKEDKLLNNNFKSELIEKEDNLNEIKTQRGRQMMSRKNLDRSKKNTAENSLKSSQQTTTCESKDKKTKKLKLTSKMKRFIKKKIKDSKNYKTNFLTVEEEKESSDSDSFYKFKKRKILYDYEEEFSQRQNFNFLDLESNDENKENSQFSLELNIDNEEVLNDEIEKILLDVYNSNILSNQKSKEFYLTKYERNISFYSLKLNRQYNIFILQILSEKLKELTKRCKEKFLEIPEINQIREKFYELDYNCADITKNKNNLFKILKQYYTDHSTECNKVKKFFSEKTQELRDFCSLKLFFKTRKEKNSKQNKKFSDDIYSGLENICNSVIEKMSNIFLTELCKIKNCLMEFGKDIERIFVLPLSHLTTNNCNLQIKVEKLLSEEFAIVLLEDEFTSKFFSKLKAFVAKFSSEDLKSIFYKLEEELYSTKHEMTNLTECFIESIKTFIQCTNSISDSNQSDQNPKSISNSFPVSNKIASSSEPLKIDEIRILTESPSIPTSASGSAFKSPDTKAQNNLGLDELLEYIHADDMKIEKKKKKGKSRKNIKNLRKKEKDDLSDKCDVNSSKNEYFPIKDEEVELFRKNIVSDSLSATSRRKIKPKISHDWIKKIVAMVNEEK